MSDKKEAGPPEKDQNPPHSSSFIHDAWQKFLNMLPHPVKPEKVLDELTIGGVANSIKAARAKKIVVMTGAGVSTAAGIPDFRSPNSGLYENLAKYDLPHPQAIFEIGYFKENPEPFFALAKELFPERLKPTVPHFFLKLLNDKNCLLRVYTQNIDTLEQIAGLPEAKVIEAHGSFNRGHCMDCKREYNFDWLKENIKKRTVPRCEKCKKGVVKPDVVLFGEALPQKFFTGVHRDFPECDLLIIMGTSLVVQPFASLVGKVGKNVPRLLINKEKAGSHQGMERLFMGPGLEFDHKDNYRDVFWQGACDDGCKLLARLLGWEEELNNMVKNGWAKLDRDYDEQGLAEKVKTSMKLNK